MDSVFLTVRPSFPRVKKVYFGVSTARTTTLFACIIFRSDEVEKKPSRETPSDKEKNFSHRDDKSFCALRARNLAIGIGIGRPELYANGAVYCSPLESSTYPAPKKINFSTLGNARKLAFSLTLTKILSLSYTNKFALLSLNRNFALILPTII